MPVHLDPELEKKLDALAAQTGRPTSELVEDAMAGYLAELSSTRDTLHRRHDELKSGPGPTDRRRRSARPPAREERAPTQPPRMSDFAFHPEAFADLTEIWEFIAEDNVDAADRVIGEILMLSGRFPCFRIRDDDARS